MNRHHLVLVSIIFALRAPLAAQDLPPADLSSATLRQCYDWAKAASESLKIRQESIVQFNQRARAALGTALPRVEWEFNDTYQDPKGVDELDRKGFSGFVEKNQMESSFSVKQPIFSGLREFSARAGFKRESLRETLNLRRADIELFERTANAFYTVISLETDRQNVATTLKLGDDRFQELRRFLRLGKARNSELFSSQSRVAAQRANLEQLDGRIHTAREELSFITAQDFSTRPLLDEIPSPPAVMSLDQALAQAKNRTDLKAQREEVEVQGLMARYERGAYWPNADLTGRYYTQRATFLDAIDWDVVLALKVPLYQGGTVSARVRQALSAQRQARWTLDEMDRRISSTIRKIHGELVAALREASALDEANLSAQKSYDALHREYGIGLTTNLEVLEALDQLQLQRSSFDNARLRAKQLYLQLGVATETLP